MSATQTAGHAALSPWQRGRLTLDAIEAVDAIGRGEWTVADARALLGDDLDAGLIQYAGLLEAMLVTLRGAPVAAVRDACRDTAQRLVQ